MANRSIPCIEAPRKRGAGWRWILACWLVTSLGCAVLVDRTLVHFANSNRPRQDPTDPLNIGFARLNIGIAGLNWHVGARFKTGTEAPDFILPNLEGDAKVQLASFEGIKPVVLVCSSLTCDVFCGHLDILEKLHRAYFDRAEFLFVNIKEAGHIIEGYEFLLDHAPDGNTAPEELRGRRTRKAMNMRNFTMPAVLDTSEGHVSQSYSAWPLRLLIIDIEGRISLDLGRGVDVRWNLSQVEEWLEANTKKLEVL